MDSLTQIVLGAAVGEAILGRKVGNRAMLWGGIAGTIPDLDVFANLSTDPLSALAYHRAFTHSLAFGVLAPWLLGPLVHRLYGGKGGPLATWPTYSLVSLGGVLFFLLLVLGSYLMPIEVFRIEAVALSVTLATFFFIVLVGLVQRWRQRKQSGAAAAEHTTWLGWVALFFGAIVTHPLLDCFTAYGTQFLTPFSSLRISWHSISVVDPIYTLPFLLFVIAAARQRKSGRLRRRLNTAGWWLSSVYLIFTVFNHHRVAQVMELSLAEQQIRASRFIVTPTIFNNILWQGIVQGQGDDYYFGRYSLLDQQRRFELLQPIVGQHELVKNYQDSRELRILNWFTDGYMSCMALDSGRVQINDLRFGILGDDAQSAEQYVFKWVLDTTKQPIELIQAQGPDEDVDMKASFGSLWTRLLGR